MEPLRQPRILSRFLANLDDSSKGKTETAKTANGFPQETWRLGEGLHGELGDAMNALVYDESGTLVHFVRSLLLGLHHRVSISLEPTDAVNKLETSLFDLIVIGPRGAPRELADRIEKEDAPVILAGTEGEIPPTGPVHAAIPRPIRPSRMVSAIERIARRAPPCEGWPAWVAAGGDRIACRATKLTQAAMMLECFAESEQDFARFFSVHDRSPIEASVRRGEIETRFAAAVAFAERGRVAVRISTGGSSC